MQLHLILHQIIISKTLYKEKSLLVMKSTIQLLKNEMIKSILNVICKIA